MPVLAMAEAATAAAAAAAKGAFGYNRANYMFDQGLRFGRFNTGYSMAMAQTSQYREDISDLTELTVTKADTYHTVGTICFVLNFQLIMAGRLGVHGPAPPGWIMGLYWTNICTALMFLVTFTWMAMHAGARATAGAAYMRTRSVRLPIPTPQMLDKARRTGNTFEKQRIQDIFRIPFVFPAGQESEVDEASGRREPISDRRMPKWYDDEVEELRKGDGGPAPSPTSVPEHFELYRGLQQEWWCYDVYSRIGILFWFSHWLTSASLYSMCHCFTELRILWPAWTVTACFVTAHWGILRLDITSKPREGSLMCLPIEKIVPFVPVLAVFGMSIDYSVLDPTPFLQGLIYTVSWICYAIQFAWAIRLYDLAAPQFRDKESPEHAGDAWSPMEWPVPPAFSQAVYLVSAPKHLERGQTCLTQEMKAAKGQKGQNVPQRKANECSHSMLPWKLFRGAIITSISMWVLIMFGRGFEQINGERFLLKQEGRVERWPSHMQPWMAPWTRKGTRQENCHAGGCDRRLSAGQNQVASLAQRLMAALVPLVDVLDAPSKKSIAPQFAEMQEVGVQWPADFRPAFLTSHDDMLAAFEREGGRGALVQSVSAKDFTAFKLEGIDGQILATTWDKSGLLVATSGAGLAECAGAPGADGTWACRQLALEALPSGSKAVAVARQSSNLLRAAIAFKGEDTVVLMDATEDGTWLPTGEVHVPVADGVRFELSWANAAQDLIISAEDGSIIKRTISASGALKVVSVDHGINMAFHGACGMAGDRVAHLASESGAAPLLFVTSA
eukprot:CAMPEP_0177172926 /NCGR_PEP_ID=MMETSP0367-20130122/11391_1 /TAXON_ID=447022 ORGANISM="Scrippsiella hangoei-like, Strain SHHI-4" /NCGR_SAMPLE_ID=MMETSP0367 /ASSEMBLY_ACC=CAM_ASM_000362 /LENGTH=785 /DNA_ID=CAMNT_0018619221 /DNA_START=8 /DNA_END=2365 /DNA_ORIENTATION=-